MNRLLSLAILISLSYFHYLGRHSAYICLILHTSEVFEKYFNFPFLLAQEQHSLWEQRVYCLHSISDKIQGLAEKYTVTKHRLLPGFNINTISKVQNLPSERY